MSRLHDPNRRVVGAFVRIPEPLQDGKVRCNACAAVVSLTLRGRTRAHKTPAGEPCAYRAFYAKVTLDEMPPVVLPPQSQPPKRIPIRKRAQQPTPEQIQNNASLAPRTNECVFCEKWLPGERTVCGACAARRERNRRRK